MLDKIKTMDVSLYPKIWSSFNSWQFPEELLEFKPQNWDLLPTDVKSKFTSESFNYIRSIIPIKELLRYWNKDRLPGTEFDIWWEESGRKPLSEDELSVLKKIGSIERAPLN